MGNFSVFSVRVAKAMWVDMPITDTSHLHPCSLATSHKAKQKVVHEVPTKEREAASSCVRFPESQSHTRSLTAWLIIEIIGRSANVLHDVFVINMIHNLGHNWFPYYHTTSWLSSIISTITQHLRNTFANFSKAMLLHRASNTWTTSSVSVIFLSRINTVTLRSSPLFHCMIEPRHSLRLCGIARRNYERSVRSWWWRHGNAQHHDTDTIRRRLLMAMRRNHVQHTYSNRSCLRVRFAFAPVTSCIPLNHFWVNLDHRFFFCQTTSFSPCSLSYSSV